VSAALVQIPVGVVVERYRAKSPWLDFVWRPTEVLAGEPSAAPWTMLAHNDETTTFYAGTAMVELFRAETANYRDNLASGSPGLWVVLRASGGEPPVSVFKVTADPSEGEAMTEAGTDLVEPVPMPEPIRAALEAFVAEHHVERPFYKRPQNRADPEALARRVPGHEDKK
jgi:hypothetical protein